MLVELDLVDQRLLAVHEVLDDGETVTDVAEHYGVSRQTLDRWLSRYGAHGVAGLVDGSSAPGSGPHQMAPATEARIIETRGEHPHWGKRTIGHWLAVERFDPVPGRTLIYRCVVRKGP